MPKSYLTLTDVAQMTNNGNIMKFVHEFQKHVSLFNSLPMRASSEILKDHSAVVEEIPGGTWTGLDRDVKPNKGRFGKREENIALIEGWSEYNEKTMMVAPDSNALRWEHDALHVSGVALATAVSNGLSSFLVLLRLKKEGQFRLRRHKPFISPSFIGEILKTGIPSAIQGAVFCLANIFVQASVNHFGETAIAGSTIAMNFEYFTYYIITAFGQTATTFTGQNYAAKQYTRCRNILWRCLLLSVLCSSVPIFTIVLFRNPLSGLFSPDAAVIENAGVRIICILLFEPICNLYEIPAGAMRGCGHATYPAVSTMIGTCVFRIVWIYTVFQSNPTLPILYRAFPLSWVITVLLVNIGGAIIACKGKNKKKENTNQCSALTE